MSIIESYTYIRDMWSSKQPTSLEGITDLVNEMTASSCKFLPDFYAMDLRADDPANYRIAVLRDSVNVRDAVSGIALSDLPQVDFTRREILPNLLHVRDAKEAGRHIARPQIGHLDRLVAHDRIDLPAERAGKVEWVLSAVHNLVSLPTTAPSAAPLSAGEHKMLQLLYQGLSAKEIARVFQISPRTIEHRVEGIKAKLGARNVAHAVALGRAREVAVSLTNSNIDTDV
ncbi:helix-turn-helix transcriptional regulator [Agrobacterium rhizogenes]|uniref:helix-turn-helix transcriptional regulator n=1 Tax=Rhizobium rhizogenes TaxID=359 RepID=UPI001571647C|nr:helix-turn-helix transcriptional regulator [Rhizobium rhizogenes]NTH14229.1 helix-turn-helix transcriptional regulator [Rhizobium rhizogenes]